MKIIKEILRYIVLTIGIAILAWFGYYALIGFSEATPSDDWTPGDTYPY